MIGSIAAARKVDPEVAALSAIARALLLARGAVTTDDRSAFASAGFTPPQLFEVIAVLAVSMMATYAGNISNPPVEAPFQAQVWKR
jgi:alkylhydroperoxidase family enzyme